MTRLQYSINICWVASLIIGFSLALTFANQFTPFWQWPIPEKLLLGSYFILIFSLLAYGVMCRFSWPRLAGFSRRAKLIWVGVSLLVGGLMLVVIPVSVSIPTPESPIPHTLKLVATGQKNPQAQASQVWLRLRRADGNEIPLTEMQADSCWETVADGTIRCLAPQPAHLTWQGFLQGDAILLFTAHPWSGIVEVRWDGQTQQLDLYDSIGISRMVTLPWQSNQTSAPILMIALYGAYTLSLGLLVFGVSVWLATKPGPDNVVTLNYITTR